MKKRTEQNRNELKRIRDTYKLKRLQIAELCGVTIWCVNAWFNPPSSRNTNDVPENMIRLLKFEIKARNIEKRKVKNS